MHKKGMEDKEQEEEEVKKEKKREEENTKEERECKEEKEEESATEKEEEWEGKGETTIGHYARKLTEHEAKKLASESELSDFTRTKFERDAKKNWDLFYKRNATHFFKDRHWMTREFPELLAAISEVDSTAATHPVLLEVGCGVGNTVFPLLEENDAVFIHACDFSPRAVEFVKAHSEYTKERCNVFVCDVTAEPLSSSVGRNSIDIALLIFVLSAITPDKMIPTLENIFEVLKPGGCLLVRDYGLYDHAMLRFQRGHKLSENFYVRQDGTRAYYFSEERMEEMMRSSGFTVAENRYIQRQTVNLKDSISVERIFIQGKFLKPSTLREQCDVIL